MSLTDWYGPRLPTQPFAPIFAPADIEAMTHQAEQPNPAQPILDALRKFYQGGLSEVLRGTRYQLPDWSDMIGNLLQSEAANAAMGVMTPIKGTGVRMGVPEAADFRPIINENRPSIFKRTMESYEQGPSVAEEVEKAIKRFQLGIGSRGDEALLRREGKWPPLSGQQGESQAEIKEALPPPDANRFMTPQAARSYMGAQRGIASVVIPEPNVLPRAAGRPYDPNRPINPQTLEEMRANPVPEPDFGGRPINAQTLAELAALLKELAGK